MDMVWAKVRAADVARADVAVAVTVTGELKSVVVGASVAVSLSLRGGAPIGMCTAPPPERLSAGGGDRERSSSPFNHELEDMPVA